ncbi:hypothetical protein K9N68_30310 [Kovacikia minuta CCNUW1]|uniref:hypothetical protein n=1 Tax=Kovacikia minuta TaxID=2931930 RepID=UPI001CCD4870|nr:hypothetical protein [Kovacikia minuta]UBF25794.1 hypothetical protein K9N68_30310 [Kovacikia minuta CCNUW1]
MAARENEAPDWTIVPEKAVRAQGMPIKVKTVYPGWREAWEDFMPRSLCSTWR